MLLDDAQRGSNPLVGIVMPGDVMATQSIEIIEGLRRIFDGDRLSIACVRLLGPDDDARVQQLRALAEGLRGKP